MTNQMRPIPPGEVLKGELEEIGMSANALAQALGVPANRVTTILRAQREITVDTALRLACFFGTTPQFWLNLQQSYDLKQVNRARQRTIRREVTQRVAA